MKNVKIKYEDVFDFTPQQVRELRRELERIHCLMLNMELKGVVFDKINIEQLIDKLK